MAIQALAEFQVWRTLPQRSLLVLAARSSQAAACDLARAQDQEKEFVPAAIGQELVDQDNLVIGRPARPVSGPAISVGRADPVIDRRDRAAEDLCKTVPVVFPTGTNGSNRRIGGRLVAVAILANWHQNRGGYDEWYGDEWWIMNRLQDLYGSNFKYYAEAVWPEVTGWVGSRGTEPFYYSYGDNVYYQDGSVYYGDQPVATEEEYAAQAEAIATNFPQTKPTEKDWMPTWRVCHDGGWQTDRCRPDVVFAARR